MLDVASYEYVVQQLDSRARRKKRLALTPTRASCGAILIACCFMSLVRALWLGLAFSTVEGCDNYRKVVDAVCADSCIGNFVGLCPRSLVVSQGGLDAGSCEDAGYSVADGSMDQKAGPCGTLHFLQYTKPAQRGSQAPRAPRADLGRPEGPWPARARPQGEQAQGLVVPRAAKRTVTIAPGVEMPLANLGGVSSAPSNYSAWLDVGGRGIDTALTYGDATQKSVAAAMAATAVARKDIFLTSKVPCCHDYPIPGIAHDCQGEYNGTALDSIKKDFAILGQMDLILLHWPCATTEQTVAAYADLETALEQGMTRAIGVSNFNASLLDAMIPAVKVPPAVNQCGHSIGAHNASHNPTLGGDDATVQWCAAHGVSYSAYSPLGGLDGLDIFNDPTVKRIAAVHSVSPAQVALRWLVQQEISIVTAADSEAYCAEDVDLFSFELTAAEMDTLAAL